MGRAIRAILNLILEFRLSYEWIESQRLEMKVWCFETGHCTDGDRIEPGRERHATEPER